MKLLDRLFLFVETLPTSDRALLKIFIALTVATVLWAIAAWSQSSTILVPERGGTLTEGIVGTPRFINPLLAVTAADKDTSALIYAGLMHLSPEGVLVPDMAESVIISDDGLTYNIILKDKLTFHDGERVSADDVLFTIAHIQNPLLKSPLRANWDGVTVERISDLEFNLVLSQSYAPFIENLTTGILPKHIWENLSTEELPFSQHNSEPIGSGPYKIERIERNRSGIPDAYVLSPFDEYHGEMPHISIFSLKFFPNEEELVSAFSAEAIDSAASLSPLSIAALLNAPENKDKYALYRAPLPRTFALFFNQNENPVFRDLSVRRALNDALDREKMVREILGGYGYPIDGPIPPGFGFDNTYEAPTSTRARLDSARDVLRQGGWKINEETGLWEKRDGSALQELKFSIATANSPAFEAAAEQLRVTWNDLGIPVDIKKFEQSDLTQTVIRPRKYEALLFGTAVGRELDFYSFWHSSQRLDPGLNIALYANITTDSMLADARARTNPEERRTSYEQFENEMRTDLPALFLYVPEFTYVTPKTIENISLTGLATPSERFSNIGAWYRETEKVWPFFNKK